MYIPLYLVLHIGQRHEVGEAAMAGPPSRLPTILEIYDISRLGVVGSALYVDY